MKKSIKITISKHDRTHALYENWYLCTIHHDMAEKKTKEERWRGRQRKKESEIDLIQRTVRTISSSSNRLKFKSEFWGSRICAVGSKNGTCTYVWKIYEINAEAIRQKFIFYTSHAWFLRCSCQDINKRRIKCKFVPHPRARYEQRVKASFC